MGGDDACLAGVGAGRGLKAAGRAGWGAVAGMRLCACRPESGDRGTATLPGRSTPAGALGAAGRPGCVPPVAAGSGGAPVAGRLNSDIGGFAKPGPHAAALPRPLCQYLHNDCLLPAGVLWGLCMAALVSLNGSEPKRLTWTLLFCWWMTGQRHGSGASCWPRAPDLRRANLIVWPPAAGGAFHLTWPRRKSGPAAAGVGARGCSTTGE